MRTERFRALLGVGLVGVLVAVGAVGGWLVFGAGDDEDDPIVVGTTAVPTTTDPGNTYEAGSWALIGNVYQSLLTFRPGEQSPVPDAAESCDFTDDDLTVFRCVLRPDLTFSNGEPVTPEDVKFSYDRILAMADRAAREAADDTIPEAERFRYAGPAALLSGLEEVSLDGEGAGAGIVFRLARPNATFPYVVASAAGAIVDDDSYGMTEPRTDGRVVGSGPFTMTAFDRKGTTELVPNADYHGAAEVPEQPVTIRYFADAGDTTGRAALTRAWDAGEIDVNAGAIAPERLSQLITGEATAGGDEPQVVESTGADIQVMAFTTDEGAPMASPTARRVAAAMLDREQISHHVYEGVVDALYSLVPAGFPGHGTPYYDAYRDEAEAGPDALRQQLRDAGLSVPVAFELAYSGGAVAEEEARLLEQQLEAYGLFEVQARNYDWETEYLPTISGAGGGDGFDAFLIGWVPDFPDPATFTDLLGPADALGTGFSDPEIDRLLATSQAEQDRARAAEHFKTINELAAEQAPIVPLWQARNFAVTVPSIGGAESLSDGSGLWRLWELHRL